MASQQQSSELEPAPATAGDLSPDGDPGSVVRRAPFADNPQVGARGQQTQQRILDAALRVFGEVGYHQCNIARITQAAGCSRASFYQYFSSRDDVFRHLTGRVARQLNASAEALDPLTPSSDGWASVRAWVARHGDIYDRYEPVFTAFEAAAESDDTLAAGSLRTRERDVTIVRSKLAAAPLSPSKLDPVIKLLLECLTRTQVSGRTLRRATPEAYPRERVDDALADVIHRTLFDLRPDVNVHPPAYRRPPALNFGPVMREVLDNDEAAGLTAAGKRTLAALMESGRDVFVARGYHGTRVDDVVSAAGVSHGAFYRYFQSKDHLAHVLAGRALLTVSEAFADIPDITPDGDSPDRATLRRWLRRYNASHTAEAATIRIWIDAAVHDDTLAPDSAAMLDWGRRRMVRFLRPRDFGDIDTEAVILTSLLSAFGSRDRPPGMIDATAYIIERGFLGR